MSAGAEGRLASVLSVLALAAFVGSVSLLRDSPRIAPLVEMQVALPRFVQVTMAGGDRYLAANIADFRALLSTTAKMGPEDFRVQAIVQRDAAWLNPAHEDNYYIAAAILPDHGEVDAAIDVLRQAHYARPFDYLPGFHLAFDLMYYKRDPIAGAEWLRRAATHAEDEGDRLRLEQMAAFWVEKKGDRLLASRLVDAMAETARPRAFQHYLKKRAERLRDLAVLEQKAEEYHAQYGVPPTSVRALVDARMLPAVPVDPLGVGFAINRRGEAVFADDRSLLPDSGSSNRHQ